MKPNSEVKVLWEDRLQESQGKRKAACREVAAERSVERTFEPTHRNRMRGGVKRGERAYDRKAPATKVWRRRSGGCERKVWFLTWGGLASALKEAPSFVGSEESAKAVLFCRETEEGPNRKRAKRA